MTLESCVPVSIKDKCYDPFFGVIKEDMADIQALLVQCSVLNLSSEVVKILL